MSRASLVVLLAMGAASLGACAEEADPGEISSHEELETVTAEIVNPQTGEVREVTGTVDMAALEEAIADEEAEKAGCVHIRWCNLNGDIVCDTNDQGCSSNARFNECNGDARAVCGKTRPMEFDPCIPCPITGVFCPAGWELCWIG